MASYPSIEFPNNVIPQTFNRNSFVSKALNSDDIITSSLNVLGPSTLNTVQSNTINNTGNLSSNTITNTGAYKCGCKWSGSNTREIIKFNRKRGSNFYYNK